MQPYQRQYQNVPWMRSGYSLGFELRALYMLANTLLLYPRSKIYRFSIGFTWKYTFTSSTKTVFQNNFTSLIHTDLNWKPVCYPWGSCPWLPLQRLQSTVWLNYTLHHATPIDVWLRVGLCLDKPTVSSTHKSKYTLSTEQHSSEKWYYVLSCHSVYRLDGKDLIYSIPTALC